jgi:hypothetical protein
LDVLFRVLFSRFLCEVLIHQSCVWCDGLTAFVTGFPNRVQTSRWSQSSRFASDTTENLRNELQKTFENDRKGENPFLARRKRRKRTTAQSWNDTKTETRSTVSKQQPEPSNTRRCYHYHPIESIIRSITSFGSQERDHPPSFHQETTF